MRPDKNDAKVINHVRTEETARIGRGFNWKNTLLPILIILILATSTAACYYFFQLADLKQNPQKLGREEAASIIEEISKIMILPENEEPTMATVTDPESLKGQSFFAKAKSGDKVLFYANARKAILYDPAAKKILEVAPINLDSSEASPADKDE